MMTETQVIDDCSSFCVLLVPSKAETSSARVEEYKRMAEVYFTAWMLTKSGRDRAKYEGYYRLSEAVQHGR